MTSDNYNYRPLIVSQSPWLSGSPRAFWGRRPSPMGDAYFGRGHLSISADRGHVKRFVAATGFGVAPPWSSGP